MFFKVVWAGPHVNEMSSTRFWFVTFVFLDTCPEKFGRRFCPRNNLSCLHCKLYKSMKVNTAESQLLHIVCSVPRSSKSYHLFLQNYVFPRYPDLSQRLFKFFHSSAGITKHEWISSSVFKQQAEKFLGIIVDSQQTELYVKVRALKILLKFIWNHVFLKQYVYFISCYQRIFK